MKILKLRYQQHKNRAHQKGTAFLLTFDQWFAIWNESGFLHLRGKRRGQYVMARYGDKGPYAVGNVKIITHGDNIREGAAGFGNNHNLGRHHRKATKIKISRSNLGRAPTLGMTGKHHSKETKIKMSNKIVTRAARRKMSIAAKARVAREGGCLLLDWTPIGVEYPSLAAKSPRREGAIECCCPITANASENRCRSLGGPRTHFLAR